VVYILSNLGNMIVRDLTIIEIQEETLLVISLNVSYLTTRSFFLRIVLLFHQITSI